MKTIVIDGENGDLIIARHGRTNLMKMERSSRIEYWQRQSGSAIIDAALKLISDHCRRNGIPMSIDKTFQRYGKRIEDK